MVKQINHFFYNRIIRIIIKMEITGDGMFTPQFFKPCPHPKFLSIETQKSKLRGLLAKLEKHTDAIHFLDPVDWKGLGLYDYPSIVKRPMDLSTVKKNLSKNKYKTLDTFLNDIDLIWKNCKTYNQIESPIYEQADIMEKVFKKAAVELKQEFAKLKSQDADVPMEEEKDFKDYKDLSYDEKLEFTNSIKKLSQEKLTRLIRLIIEKWPQSKEEKKGDLVQIEIDLIDRETFEEAKGIINE